MKIPSNRVCKLTRHEGILKKIREDGEWRKIERKWRSVMEQAFSESLLWVDTFRELWTEK